MDPYSDAGRVHIMDEVCAVIYLICSTIASVQCVIYPSDAPYKSTVIVWTLVFTIFIVAGLLEGYAGIFMKSYFGVSWLVYAALGKAASTFLKYFMQAFHNYNRKSVTGVSPLAIGIDFFGATFALI